MTGAQLGLDFEAPRLVRVTPARLGTWDDCPRRYRLTYLDRPAPVRSGARAASTLGAVVHLALRSLFTLPPERRTPEAAAMRTQLCVHLAITSSASRDNLETTSIT